MRLKARTQAGAGAAARHARSSWWQPMDRVLTLSEVRAMYSAGRMATRAGSVSHGAEHPQEADARRLLLTGRGQQCLPQPVGPGLTGSANGPRHFPSLSRSQAHLEHVPEESFLRQTWPPNFFCHRPLTTLYLSCTKRTVLLFKTESCQQDARTSLVRLANQRHPAVTGAGIERLAVKADRNQVRSLAIEATGDFFYRKITPRIRLAGRWLEQAGFKPGHRVEVRIEQAGSLSLRFLEQPEEAGL